MLTALFATTMLALAASAGMFGSGVPGKRVADVPELSRALVRQAIVEEPDWQHFQLLAYSRRADELLRLRELSASPARAVVEYAEQAQGEVGENTPRHPETSGPSARAAPESVAVATAPVVPPPDSTASTRATTGATQSIAPPAAGRPGGTTLPAESRGGSTEIASVQAGTDATETANAPDQRKLDAKRPHGIKAHRKRPKPARVTAVPQRILPAAKTGFPIDTLSAPSTPAPPPQPLPRPNDALINARIDAGR